MSRGATQRAERFAWPHVAREVLDAYEDAIATPAPQRAGQRAAVRIGAQPADLEPRVRPQRLPSLEPPPPAGARRPAIAFARRAAMLAFAALALVGRCSRSAASACTRSSSRWWTPAPHGCSPASG